MKILLITAMPSETEDLVARFSLETKEKIVDFFPFYYGILGSNEIFLVQTHVGSINAPAATALAIKQISPDSVIKVGCIGGNSAGVMKNDLIVPISYFHSGAWLTRKVTDNIPTSNAAEWQSLFGELPYQNNKVNLGGLDYVFYPDPVLTQTYISTIEDSGLEYKKAHLGTGDMVISDRKFMEHMKVIQKIPLEDHLCTDNESHSVAQVCAILATPFTGVYFVASSDYDDIDGYDPDAIRNQTRETILPLVEKLLLRLK